MPLLTSISSSSSRSRWNRSGIEDRIVFSASRNRLPLKPHRQPRPAPARGARRPLTDRAVLHVRVLRQGQAQISPVQERYQILSDKFIERILDPHGVVELRSDVVPSPGIRAIFIQSRWAIRKCVCAAPSVAVVVDDNRAQGFPVPEVGPLRTLPAFLPGGHLAKNLVVVA